MTENEALYRIKDLEYECINSTIHYYTDKDIPTLQIAQKAVEGIQQYRAIGTVEQLEWCKDASHWKSLYEEKLAEYQSIGTVEEFKALKEKAEPKKPNAVERKRDEDGFIYQLGECPYCRKYVTDGRECCDCGQKLDWT